MTILDLPPILVHTEGSDELKDICDLLPLCPDCKVKHKFMAKDEDALYFGCPKCGHAIDLELFAEKGGDEPRKQQQEKALTIM